MIELIRPDLEGWKISALGLWRTRNDPYVYLTCRQNLPLYWEDHLEYYEKVRKDKSVEFFWFWSDELEDVHGVVGQGGLTSIDHVNGHAEYSLLIQPKYQGKGYSKDALNKILEVAFSKLRLNLVWGEIFEFNKKGIRVAESLGFKTDGTLRQRYFRDGRYIDSIMVSIRREEWLASVSGAEGR